MRIFQHQLINQLPRLTLQLNGEDLDFDVVGQAISVKVHVPKENRQKDFLQQGAVKTFKLALTRNPQKLVLLLRPVVADFRLCKPCCQLCYLSRLIQWLNLWLNLLLLVEILTLVVTGIVNVHISVHSSVAAETRETETETELREPNVTIELSQLGSV